MHCATMKMCRYLLSTFTSNIVSLNIGPTLTFQGENYYKFSNERPVLQNVGKLREVSIGQH